MLQYAQGHACPRQDTREDAWSLAVMKVLKSFAFCFLQVGSLENTLKELEVRASKTQLFLHCFRQPQELY